MSWTRRGLASRQSNPPAPTSSSASSCCECTPSPHRLSQQVRVWGSRHRRTTEPRQNLPTLRPCLLRVAILWPFWLAHPGSGPSRALYGTYTHTSDLRPHRTLPAVRRLRTPPQAQPSVSWSRTGTCTSPRQRLGGSREPEEERLAQTGDPDVRPPPPPLSPQPSSIRWRSLFPVLPRSGRDSFPFRHPCLLGRHPPSSSHPQPRHAVLVLHPSCRWPCRLLWQPS